MSTGQIPQGLIICPLAKCLKGSYNNFLAQFQKFVFKLTLIQEMNSTKRKYCGHCDRLVSLRTHRLHFKLHYDVNAKKWRPNDGTQQDASDSSDDDSILPHVSGNSSINTGDDSLQEESEHPLFIGDSMNRQGKQHMITIYYLCMRVPRAFIISRQNMMECFL